MIPRRRHSFVAMVAGLLGLVAPLRSAAPPRPDETFRVSDSLAFASQAARQAHAVRFEGASIRSDRATVGTRTVPVAGIAIEPGGFAEFVVRSSQPAGLSHSLMLTFATAPSDYGKPQRLSVSADGRELARLGESDPGGGVLRSYFLELPRTLQFWRIKVYCERTSQCRVTLVASRVYSGESGAPSLSAGAIDDRERIGLALLSTKGSGYSLDEDEIRRLRKLLPISPFVLPQTAVLYNYCTRTASDTSAEIARLVSLAEKTNIPLRIAFQTHWAGLPAGVSDGAGGAFTDLPYQQITYDPDDGREEEGLGALMGDRSDVRFGLSTPNVWSDTPWLTMNHPRLNQFRRIRLAQAISAWRRERDRLGALGLERLLPIESSTGDETVYWAKGVEDSKHASVNGGKPRENLMADFNPYVALDALHDRVSLDPRDGLDGNERWWLHQNLGRQQQRLIDWMFEALPADPIRISAGVRSFATDLPRRNLFTEPYGMPLYPMKDANPYHPGMELGSVRNGRPGAEYWSGSEMVAWLAKQREFGRSALPNLESTGASDPQFVACLQAAYAFGARYVMIYNWQRRGSAPALLREFAASIAAGVVTEWPPFGSAQPATDEHSKPAAREFTASEGAFGCNRIEAAVLGTTSQSFVRLTLASRDEDRSVRVTVPVDPRGWAPMTRKASSAPVRLSKAVTRASQSSTQTSQPAWIAASLPGVFPLKPGERYKVSVEVLGPGRAAMATDDMAAVRIAMNLRLERRRSLAVQDWKDAQDLIESVKQLQRALPQGQQAVYALRESEDLLYRNLPRQAYRRAIQAEQLTLPAVYEITAPGGRLEPYWLQARFGAGRLRATLRSYTDQAVTVELRSDQPQEVELNWAGRLSRASLAARVPAELTIDRRSLPVQPSRPTEPPIRIVPGR